MKNLKVYVVGGSLRYSSFIKECEVVDDIKSAQVVIFTGGEDVSPSMYGCRKHKKTNCNKVRDEEEKKIFERIRKDQLVLGICRGSQFLCVMNGGILVQDVPGHATGRTHEITNGEMAYQITSTHHQMQYPYVLNEKEYSVLYWSSLNAGNYEGDKVDGNIIMEKGEPEIVLYKKKGNPTCLAIQGHPEMMVNAPVVDMLNKLIEEYVH